MYAFTALLSKFLTALKDRFSRESACQFCAHHDLALRRTPVYTCPRCATVYKRKED